MESRTKVIVSFAVLIILIFGFYFFTDWFSKTTGYVLGEDEKIKLAQCLDGKEAILYVSSTCPKCIEQIDLFGEEASKFIQVLECENAELGDCAKIKGVPSWKINGEFYLGKKTLQELIDISGCSVDES